MKLVFDPEFDRGRWPGPLAERSAVAGEEWVGESGLLGRLELALGLGGPPLRRSERAAALVPRLRSLEGFWSASADVDPIGTAQRVLEWRDTLGLAGWDGRSECPRLRALAEVTEGAWPGVPERLSEVAAILPRRRIDLDALDLLVSSGDLRPAWRAVLAALARRGTDVRERVPQEVPATDADLHRARRSPFEPRGDGSLVLLRAYGPLASAEEVAVWLASLPSLDQTVVVSPDSCLDEALGRHGLPTLGAAPRPGENLLLRIVPLVLSLGWDPIDPERALDLLTLPEGPIPAPLARRLTAALHEWPAVDSDVWRAAVASGLAEIADEPRRRRVEQRIGGLFDAPVARRSSYPATELTRRLTVVEAWMRGRQAHADAPARGARWSAPLEQIASVRRLIELSGLSEYSAAQLQWLLESATELVMPEPLRPAQAGLFAVGTPGAVAGPATTVVWWNFTLDATSPIDRLPLLPIERLELAAAGVQLPDPGREALFRAIRWRRPLVQATERLLLVSPRHREDGDAAFPHPLWDEILAHVPRVADRACLETDRAPLSPSAPRRHGSARAVPAPRREWKVPGALVGDRAVESPSSLSDALGCSFRWAMHHVAGIRAGAQGELPHDELLTGRLAHEILARVLSADTAGPEEASRRAEELFDTEGVRWAAPFFLPGGDEARGQARLAISRAAETLTSVFRASGLQVRASETNRTCAHGEWSGRLQGRPDLEVGDPPAIVDLKWGGAKYRRRSLEEGTALQLAAYSLLIKEGEDAPWPAVAYFILKDQRLLTTNGATFIGAEVVPGPDPEDVWFFFESAYRSARESRAGGLLVAPGNPDEDGNALPDADSVDGDRLIVSPPCKVCDFASLCGRLYGDTE